MTAQALCSCVRTHHFVACPQFQKLIREKINPRFLSLLQVSLVSLVLSVVFFRPSSKVLGQPGRTSSADVNRSFPSKPCFSHPPFQKWCAFSTFKITSGFVIRCYEKLQCSRTESLPHHLAIQSGSHSALGCVFPNPVVHYFTNLCEIDFKRKASPLIRKVDLVSSILSWP